MRDFVICVTIVIRGNRADLQRTSRQRLRIQRARRSLWVLAVLICLTIAHHRGAALTTALAD